MSKIFRDMFAAGRDSRKPVEERKRYSVLDDDAGFANYQAGRVAGKECTVRLDGKEIKGCVTADEATGYVLCYEMPLRLAACGTKPVSYERRGVVAVEWSEANNG